MRSLALLGLLLLQIAPANRPTLTVARAEFPRRNFHILYYDDAFLFVGRHFGSAADPGGNTEPGLFVHSKEKDRWLQITAISTADGKFGTSNSDDPEAKRRLMVPSVGWNFAHLAAQPYAHQPLQTGGSIVFPDRVEVDDLTDRYRLRYMSSWGIPSAETVLYIHRAELVQAFAKAYGRR